MNMPFSKSVTAVALSLSLSSFFYSSLALAQQISGKVTNAKGNAIANAKISTNNEQQTVFSDAQGYFSLPDLPQGMVELHISSKNYHHVNKRIELSSQNIDGLAIELSPTVIEIIDVYATPLHASSIESALPVNVLSSDELRMKQASTLGETLKNEVGVHSTYYGPVASSPIIRGLDGPRVLVMQNGLDAGDASRVGPDHVVASETSTATQIEVLRGPATLFYGSGAIGGVVNVVDTRIPTSTDTSAEWLLQHNTVANENQASINLQSGMGQVAWHLDAFWRESGDYKIAGEAEFNEEKDHDEEGHEPHDDSNTLANSASQSDGFTLGSSYLLDNGYLGFSYGLMNRTYGVPGHAHHDEVDIIVEPAPDEGVSAVMKQQRFQLLSELNFTEHFINRVNTKFAFTDYQHQEIEQGAVGTQFSNNSGELRIDLYHKESSGFTGAWTLHYKQSDFEAIGEEAFTPPSNTKMLAAAWLEEKHFGEVLLQLGARIEQVSVDAKNDISSISQVNPQVNPQVNFKEQTFTPFSTSAGLVWDFKKGYNLGLSLAYSQRAPSAAELFSNGPHIGTNTFELGALYDINKNIDGSHEVIVGDQQVAEESSTNIDITLRKFSGSFGFVVSAFYNRVDDFYYQQDTGLLFIDDELIPSERLTEHQQEEGLPVLVFRQDDVTMMGLEAEFVMQISEPLKVTWFSDYIRAKLNDGGNLPRIPPMRTGLVFNYQAESFSTELSISHYFDQTDISERETETDGYTMVDANVNYYLDGFGSDTVLFVKAQNLTNVNARVHSSFLKNDAPLPGRGFSLGIRGSF
jgi:iron complex outermembrane receptor protein